MKKKVLALFLSAALCVTVLPATGMAAEFGSGDAEITENAENSEDDPEVLLTELIPEVAGDSMEEENAEAMSASATELTVPPITDPEPRGR